MESSIYLGGLSMGLGCGSTIFSWVMQQSIGVELCEPWTLYVINHFDFVRRLKSVFKLLESFKVCIIFAVLESLDCVLQFYECIDSGIRWCDCGLHDMLVLEENHACQSFCPYLLAEYNEHSVMLL